MIRDLDHLASTHHDLLVIGGGAYGVCAAWEGALRGLHVALIERGDFGEATSSNSLHTMHGGLRYLQHLDIRRMRESIRERRFWLRTAPELVTPMPFVLPTFGHGLRGPEVMQAALLMNDVISADRNHDVLAGARLPRGRRLSREAARKRFGSLRIAGFNGAALWYDGFNSSPERLLIALLQAARDAGATLANYCSAEALECAGGRVVGATVLDQLSGRQYPVRARCVLNATGPWVDTIAAMAGRRSAQPLFRPSRAMNLVVPRLPFDTAIGMPAPRRGQELDSVLDKGAVTYFIMPWNEYSLIGTKHLRCLPGTEEQNVQASDVEEFLGEINPVLGDLRIATRDVLAVKHGLLPEKAGASPVGDVVLQKHSRIVDHEVEDGIGGLISLVGVKWTTARSTAERSVMLAMGKIGRSVLPFNRPERLMVESVTLGEASPEDVAGVSGEQIRRAAKNEWACQLTDVIFRRTGIGLSRVLDRAVLSPVAALMGAELGWSANESERQLLGVLDEWKRRQAWRF